MTIGAEGIEAQPDEEIIVADDPEEFARKTLYLLKHSEEAQKIGPRARRVIEKKYDWEVIDTTIRKVYKEFENENSLENKHSVVSGNT